MAFHKFKRNALPKKIILRGKEKFDFIFKNGSSLKGRNITILFVESQTEKVGFVVSKRIKGAVQRNYYKRILREIYRQNKEKFPIQKELILIAKGREKNVAILRGEILNLLKKEFNI